MLRSRVRVSPNTCTVHTVDATVPSGTVALFLFFSYFSQKYYLSSKIHIFQYITPKLTKLVSLDCLWRCLRARTIFIPNFTIFFFHNNLNTPKPLILNIFFQKILKIPLWPSKLFLVYPFIFPWISFQDVPSNSQNKYFLCFSLILFIYSY